MASTLMEIEEGQCYVFNRYHRDADYDLGIVEISKKDEEWKVTVSRTSFGMGAFTPTIYFFKGNLRDVDNEGSLITGFKNCHSYPNDPQEYCFKGNFAVKLSQKINEEIFVRMRLSNSRFDYSHSRIKLNRVLGINELSIFEAGDGVLKGVCHEREVYYR